MITNEVVWFRWDSVDDLLSTVTALQRGPDPELGRVVVDAASLTGEFGQGLAIIDRLKRCVDMVTRRFVC